MRSITLLILLLFASTSFAAQWLDHVKTLATPVNENTAEHQIIERAYERILRTPSGLSLCLIMQGDQAVLSKLLGLSLKTSTNLAQICIENAQRLWNNEIKNFNIINPSAKNNMLRRPQKFYFIVPDSAEFPYDSWTDLENNTYISASAFHSDRMIHVLIHELQIAFDSKSRLSAVHLGEIEDGWTVYSKSLFKPFVERDLRQQLALIHESGLKRIFAIVRAFNFEIAVLRELDSESANTKFIPQTNSEQNCNQVVDILIKEYSQSDEGSRLNQNWEAIRKSHLGFKYPGRNINEISFCQFMTIPSFASTDFRTEGPRPRIRPTTQGEFAALHLNLSKKDREAFKGYSDLYKSLARPKRSQFLPNSDDINLNGDAHGKTFPETTP